jgi:hypothetical protein
MLCIALRLETLAPDVVGIAKRRVGSPRVAVKVIARLVPVSSNSRTLCCPEARRSATGGSSSIFGTIAPTPSSALQRIAKFWADVDAGNEPKPDFYRDDAIIKALHKGDTESLTHDPILCSRKRAI